MPRWPFIALGLIVLTLAACNEGQLADTADRWCRNSPDCDHADEGRLGTSLPNGP